MCWLSAVGLCVFMQQATFGREQLNNDDSHVNIAIDDRPGVYYEQMTPLRLQQANWKVSVFVKVQKFIDSFPRVNGKINETVQKCNMAHSYDRFRELLQQESIEEQTREAAGIARELHALASKHELRGTSTGAPINSMKKRSIPFRNNRINQQVFIWNHERERCGIYKFTDRPFVFGPGERKRNNWSLNSYYGLAHPTIT